MISRKFNMGALIAMPKSGWDFGATMPMFSKIETYLDGLIMI